MSMYGSVHTHFESRFDTANELQDMLSHFLANGARKVAVTEHGVFSSYEDLRDIVGDMKKKVKNIKAFAEEKGINLSEVAFTGSEPIEEALKINWHNDKVSDKEKEIFDEMISRGEEGIASLARLVDAAAKFDVIPGIEGYFGDNKAHLILIAKDYEGYLSLCKIISQSNEWLRDNGGEKAQITAENLRENVAKGHVFCTSACVAGPFGHVLGLDKANVSGNVAKHEYQLTSSGYFENSAMIAEYEEKQKRMKECKVTKTERTQAEKTFKRTGMTNELDDIAARDAEYAVLEAYLAENKARYDACVTGLKAYNTAALTRKVNSLAKEREELERLSRVDGKQEARELLSFFREVFGDENFFLELQNHDIPIEKEIYNAIVDFGKEEGFEHFIASNDVHVGVRKTDADYEDQLKRRNVIKFTRWNSYSEERPDDREYVIKSDEELSAELKKIIPDDAVIESAIGNIETLLSQCGVEFPEEKHYPKFCEDENAEFERQVREGIKIKFPNGFPDERYEKALNMELDVIKKMGYAGYHLIVADYLNYGRLLGYLPTEEEVKDAPNSLEELKAYLEEKGYPKVGYNIGPGRGSAVGSLCCYLMGITDIDPIPYNLFFERFLNVERVSMPDIDSDFRTDIRDRVVDYCRAKYGKECICQIMTKGYGATKGNLRLAARYLGAKAYAEKYRATNAEDIGYDEEGEDTPEMYDTATKKAREKELEDTQRIWAKKADELSKACDKDGNLPDQEFEGDYKLLAELAEKLDGVFMNYGQHAAGTIISSDDVTKIIPLMWNGKKGSMETQCTMAQAEAKGLLKMDFLGLKNLDIITEIVRHPSPAVVKDFLERAPKIYKDNMEKGVLDTTLQDYARRDSMLRDPNIFKRIFCAGATQGVFQFESPGMKKMLQDFQPESFEDIILLVAAYRPGPMDYIPEIVQQKRFEKGEIKKEPNHSITIKNADLDKILASTYHCPIYQEQIMQIFQQMAGYSLGGADLVRRAMSKKKTDVLMKEKEAFIHGDPERNILGAMAKQGLTEKEADDLFEQMMPFAKYGFNKSHATAYAMVAMFTAYLKLYHTADFYRASLDAVKELAEIPDFVRDMQQFGLTMLPPSMMESQDNFTVTEDGKGIRFGLKYIKGFGSQEGIYRAESVEEFLKRNPSVTVKTAITYAQLGMFRGAWAADLRRRPTVTRHDVIRMLERDGEVFKKYYAYAEKVEELIAERNRIAEEMEKSGSLDDKELKKVERSIESYTAKRKEQGEILTRDRQEDYSLQVQKETTKETLENRNWEMDFLSIPFDYHDSLEKIRKSSNRNTFENLKDSQADIGKTEVRVPCVILSISDVKYTKSGNPYYEALLMDRDQNMITRRFDKPIDLLEGDFPLPIEECRHYTCRSQYGRRITENYQGNKQGGFRYEGDLSREEKVKMIRNGSQMNRMRSGGTNIPVLTPEEKAERFASGRGAGEEERTGGNDEASIDASSRDDAEEER